MKDPSLLSPDVRAYASYPGGHNEGFPDTFKQTYSAVYSYIIAGDYDSPTTFATFTDGHMELVIGEAILRSAREGRWVAVGE
jgi:predicted dehydrogenase